MKWFMNFKIITLRISLVIFTQVIYGQQPIWPVDNTVAGYNQINCTFAERHTELRDEPLEFRSIKPVHSIVIGTEPYHSLIILVNGN